VSIAALRRRASEVALSQAGSNSVTLKRNQAASGECVEVAW